MEQTNTNVVEVAPKVVALIQVRLPGMEWAQHVNVWNAVPPYARPESSWNGRANTSNVTGVAAGDHNEVRWTIRTLQRVFKGQGVADTGRFFVVDRGDGTWNVNVDHRDGFMLYGALTAERRRRASRKGYAAMIARREERNARKRDRNRYGSHRAMDREDFHADA